MCGTHGPTALVGLPPPPGRARAPRETGKYRGSASDQIATGRGKKTTEDGRRAGPNLCTHRYRLTGRPRYGKATTDMKHVTQKGAEDAGTARRLHHLTRWLRGRRRLAGVLGSGRTGVPRLAGRSAGGGLHRPDGS